MISGFSHYFFCRRFGLIASFHKGQVANECKGQEHEVCGISQLTVKHFGAQDGLMFVCSFIPLGADPAYLVSTE